MITEIQTKDKQKANCLSVILCVFCLRNKGQNKNDPEKADKQRESQRESQRIVNRMSDTEFQTNRMPD